MFVYAKRFKVQICTLILLTNFAEARWVSVSCDQKILQHTVCVKKNRDKISQLNLKKVRNYSTCDRTNLIVNAKCYLFIWDKKTKYPYQYCRKFNGKLEKSGSVMLFRIVFDAISVPNYFPSLFFKHNQNSTDELNYNSHTKLFETCTDSEYNKEGYHVCTVDRSHILIGNLFNCTKGGYIL